MSSRVLDEHEKTVLTYGIRHSLAPQRLPKAKAPSTRTRVNLKPGKYFHGYACRPHVTG